jgi:Tfp pilus assembly protein PilF
MKRLALCVAAAVFLGGCGLSRRLVRFNDPLTPEEHIQLGLSYENQNLPTNAEREYRAALHGDKRNVVARVALGNLAYAGGRLDEAETAFRAAVKLAPDNAAANNNLAMVLAERGRDLTRAEKCAQKAAADARFRPYALDTLAGIYARQGRFADAERALADATANAPANDAAMAAQLEKTRQFVADRRNSAAAPR